MTIRRLKCEECGSDDLVVLKELEPNTRALRMDVMVRCRVCGHEAKRRVISHHAKQQRRTGRVRI
jgi:uncharacterized Zn finger protein